MLGGVHNVSSRDSAVKIVTAKQEHVPFIAWATLTANRAHLDRGSPEIYVGQSEADALAVLATGAMTSVLHPIHFTNFLIELGDGVPVAALCGFRLGDYDPECVDTMFAEVNDKLGRTMEQHEAGMRRVESMIRVTPEFSANAWVIEAVATRPEFRRRGCVARLTHAILALGRQRGLTIAEVGVHIGNTPAQSAYEAAGFRVVGERRDDEFEAVFGTPGMRLLRRSM
jgi:ribosomal protein S18 acetylase RimI-like enzyme